MSSMRSERPSAFLVGTLCAAAYFAVYLAKNILSVFSPSLLEAGSLSEGQMGVLSALFFFSYAVGQLLNGRLGDRVRVKTMLFSGLGLGGVCCVLFPALPGERFPEACGAFGFLGFFLSMIFGPITKAVTENTPPKYVARCTLGYTLTSFLGAPAAGLIAAFCPFRAGMLLCGGFLAFTALVCFLLFSLLERRGLYREGAGTSSEKEKTPSWGETAQKTPGKGPEKIGRLLLRRRILPFTLFSMLTGIVRTTVVFFLPTYFSESLGLTPKLSNLLFSVSTLVLCLSGFLAVSLYEALGGRLFLSMGLFFLLGVLCFFPACFVKTPVCNAALMILAILAANCASTLIWSVYCPKLRDTGAVSSATGFLDFAGYMASAAACALFVPALSYLHWNGLLLCLAGMMALGCLFCLPFFKRI